MEENYNTQAELVLNHLLKEGSITSMEAIERYGVTRLAAVVCQLRKDGFIIKTLSKRGKNRYGKTCTFAEYRMGE